MMKKMMERMNLIRENQKKNGKKGFSMIELIIVIAIMAILVALIGTQLIPYLEKSRRTRDLDTLNAALTAVQTVVSDHEIDPSNSTDLAKVTSTYSDELDELLGYDHTQIDGKMTSSGASGGLTISGDSNGVITLSVGDLYVTSGGEKGQTSSGS